MAKCAECVHNDVCVLWRKPALYGIINRDLGCDRHFKSNSNFVEVVHGLWIGQRCSVCNESYMDYADADSYPAVGEPKPNYCPNCGARMDGDWNDC